MSENEIAKIVVDAAFKVHTTLGPGLLESAYQKVMVYELRRRGLRVEPELPIDIVYEELVVKEAFSADLVVEGKVIVELKSVEQVIPVHKKQLLTYLKLTDKHLGLLINFNVVLIKDGITRIVHNLV
jgi:GxxExxY protein